MTGLVLAASRPGHLSLRTEPGESFAISRRRPHAAKARRRANLSLKLSDRSSRTRRICKARPVVSIRLPGGPSSMMGYGFPIFPAPYLAAGYRSRQAVRVARWTCIAGIRAASGFHITDPGMRAAASDGATPAGVWTGQDILGRPAYMSIDSLREQSRPVRGPCPGYSRMSPQRIRRDGNPGCGRPVRHRGHFMRPAGRTDPRRSPGTRALSPPST